MPPLTLINLLALIGAINLSALAGKATYDVSTGIVGWFRKEPQSEHSKLLAKLSEKQLAKVMRILAEEQEEEEGVQPKPRAAVVGAR